MNQTLKSIFASSQVRSASGEVFGLHSAIDRREGSMLFETIRSDESVRNTLEVGCAYGISSLYICEALRGRDGRHTILDPFQETQWHGIGLENLRREGFDYYEHIAKPSEIALPELLAAGRTYDFIFLDGIHTLDHCLLEAFYATRLLRVGGYLALDDVAFPGVDHAYRYLLKYPCYEIHSDISSQPSWRGRLLGYKNTTKFAVLKKRREDERPWDWY